MPTSRHRRIASINDLTISAKERTYHLGPPVQTIPSLSDTNVARVRYWHLTDMPIALANVRFEGNNGHGADVRS